MKKNKALIFVMVCTSVVLSASCSIFGGGSQSLKAAATGTIGSSSSKASSERVISWSPKGDIKLQLGKDNNLYISDEKGERIVYRNYEKDRELFNNPYSLWSFDFFRIQWSGDGQYVYIIDSIYDVSNDKLIPIKDCLIFSWVENRGVYLAGGKVVEGKFWDNGFYGFYASKCVKIFEDGEVKTAKDRTDDRYYVVSESNWEETEKTLFKGLWSSVEVKSAKFKFDEEKMYDKLIKAYQELREDEKAWKTLNSEYLETDSRHKAMADFNKLKSKYPIKLLNEDFESNRLNWDFDMNYYLVDIRTEEIS